MSDSVRPHRRQPTRLPRPWDSPGKNTGVGCHFLLQRVKVKSLSHVRLFTVSPFICREFMGPYAMILVFWMLSFKPSFSLSSFTFIKRRFSFVGGVCSFLSSVAAKIWSGRPVLQLSFIWQAKENTSSRYEGGPTQKNHRAQFWVLFLNVVSPPLECALCKLG